ncbi:nitrate ABC transporter permease [Streptomyces sp. CNQ-509]|uniref:ABC transporter permease n=1 Tax=unclassified Streptomyces TaxID=2593676 RepID=UPI00062DE5A7|nr:ABC transporter permease [Streptomyces sp. CNQ-509]AKH85966.1 nitrate ABC transporter permease [Streptomyces sp. CNQ-509]
MNLRPLLRRLPAVLVAGAAVGVWYLISMVVLAEDRRFLFPPPHDVVRVGFLDGDNRAELLDALLLSAQVASLGLLISAAGAIAMAILMSQARWLERSLFPYFVVLQVTPILALVPLFGFWWGYGFSTRVLVCVIIAFFPILTSTLFGIRSADSSYHDLFRLQNAGRLTRLWKLQLPAALPHIFTGLRIAAGMSVVGAIVGDFFFRQGQPGIGVLIDLYQSRLQSEQLLAAVLVSSLFGVLVFWFFGRLARIVVGGWHESADEPGAKD